MAAHSPPTQAALLREGALPPLAAPSSGPSARDCDPGPAGRPAVRPEEGLIEVLSRNRAVLRSVFRKYQVDLADAEDILQESLLLALRRWDTLDDPSAFVVGAVKLRIFRLFKRRRIENAVPLAELPPVGGGEGAHAAVEARHDAHRLLASLPERAATIVELRYGEDLASREVAAALDCSDASVRVAASRGLRRLRRHAELRRYRP